MLGQCSLGASASEKAEAGRINHAIEQLRAAPNPEKGERLDALKAVACETAELCELQRVCVDGYGQHVFALAEVDRAKALIATQNRLPEAGQIVEAARSELAEAAPKISRCADAQGAVQRKYKL